MNWINPDIEKPEHYQDVETITNKGQTVTAWIDQFESDDCYVFDLEWMEREPLDFIVKWRPIPPTNIQQQAKAGNNDKANK